MGTFKFWQTWLLTVSLIILLFGAGMALASGTPLFDLFHRQIDPSFWGGPPAEAGTRAYQAWVYGVWGATLAGWGVFLGFLAAVPFKKKEKWAWTCLAAGLLLWFVLDTGLSALHGVWFNVAVNGAILILAGLPLAFTRKFFRE